jgi:hypothetical protein
MKHFSRAKAGVVQCLVWPAALISALVLSGHSKPACADQPNKPEHASETLDYLRELAKRKSAVRHKLATLPEKINEETARIMEALDKFWASDRAAALHTAFIEKATAEAEDIHLDDQYSTLDTVWAEYKSLASDDLLEEMTTSYVNKIHAGIKVDQDRLSDALQAEMKKDLDPVFEQAQRSLAETFDSAIQSQFRFWPECFVRFPPVVSESPDVAVPGGSGPGRRLKTIAGIVLILIGRLVASLVRKIVTRVTRTVATKLMAKAAGKLIPYLGLLLLAWDLADAARARSKFEATVRKEFLTELAKETTPGKLWSEKDGGQPSMRDDVEGMVKNQLTEWVALAREEADSFLDAASLADNPAFKDFVAQFDEERKRVLEKDPEAAAAQLNFFIERCEALHGTFGPICQTVSSFDTLEEMLLVSPDKTSLKLLVDTLGTDAVSLFEKHGKVVLEASAVLSAPVLAKLVAEGKDWQGLYVEYRHLLGPNPTPAMREGLALAIDNGFDVKSYGNSEFLSRLGQHAEVFKQLCKAGVPPLRIRDCLSRDQAAAFLDAMAIREPSLLLPVVNNIEPVRLQRFMAENYGETIATTWATARKLGYDASGYCAVIKDSEELFEAQRDYADKGAEIYLSYVKDGVGASQRENARTALWLYGKNCPLELCLDRQNLSMTSFFYGLPLGPQVYALIYRLNSFVPYLGWILGWILVLTPLYLLARLLGFWGGGRGRKSSRSMTVRRRPVDITVAAEKDRTRYDADLKQPLPGKPAALDAPQPPDTPSA